MSLYIRSINSIVSFYVIWWCQSAIMSVLTNANYENNSENTTRDINISDYNTKYRDGIIIESREARTETDPHNSQVLDKLNSSAIHDESDDYKHNHTDLKQNTDDIIFKQTPNTNIKIEVSKVVNSIENDSNNYSTFDNLIITNHTKETQEETVTGRTPSVTLSMVRITEESTDDGSNATTSAPVLSGNRSNTFSNDIENHTTNNNVLYVEHNFDAHGNLKPGKRGFKQIPIRRHHLQIVPMEDEPFGAILWKDERYMVSVIIPIGVGITGAAVIMITLYTLRYIARKNAHRFHFPDLEHATQTTSCISSISSERTDRVVLLGADEDDEF